MLNFHHFFYYTGKCPCLFQVSITRCSYLIYSFFLASWRWPGVYLLLDCNLGLIWDSMCGVVSQLSFHSLFSSDCPMASLHTFPLPSTFRAAFQSCWSLAGSFSFDSAPSTTISLPAKWSTHSLTPYLIRAALSFWAAVFWSAEHWGSLPSLG